jgi:hypothetical protein
MPDPTPTDSYTRRWHALLAEHEHLEMTSSFTLPFSEQQEAQLNLNATRRQKLAQKLHNLVDEWAADARGGALLPASGPPFHKSQRRPRR